MVHMEFKRWAAHEPCQEVATNYSGASKLRLLNYKSFSSCSSIKKIVHVKLLLYNKVESKFCSAPWSSEVTRNQLLFFKWSLTWYALNFLQILIFCDYFQIAAKGADNCKLWRHAWGSK